MAHIAYAEGSQGDNILRIHSLNPKSGEAHEHLYRAVMHGAGELTRLQREMIGVVVSGINGCHYWVVHHSAWFRRLGSEDSLAAQLADDYTRAPLEPSDRAMLDYAVKVTRAPASVTRADVDGLRKCGFSDASVLDMCQVAGYFAFANRLADGLGIELE